MSLISSLPTGFVPPASTPAQRWDPAQRPPWLKRKELPQPQWRAQEAPAPAAAQEPVAAPAPLRQPSAASQAATAPAAQSVPHELPSSAPKRHENELAAQQEALAKARQEETRRAADDTVRNGGQVEGHFLPEEKEVHTGLTSYAERLGRAGVPAEEAFLRAEKELRTQPGWSDGRRGEYWRHFWTRQQQESGRLSGEETQRQAQAGHLEKRGFSGVAGEMKALQEASATRRAEVLRSFPDAAGDEAQAALKAHEEETAAKHAALMARADEQVQKVAALYEASFKDKDPSAWNQPGTANAEIQEAAAQLGMPEQDVRYWLDYHRRADWSRPLTKAPEGIDAIKQAAEETLLELAGKDTLQDKVRVLPDGGITVNPELYGDQEAFEKAVRQSGASKAVQEAALARYPELQRQWARSIMPALMDQAAIPIRGTQTFTQWWMNKAEDVRAGREDAAFLAQPDEDKVLQYVAENHHGSRGIRRPDADTGGDRWGGESSAGAD